MKVTRVTQSRITSQAGNAGFGIISGVHAHLNKIGEMSITNVKKMPKESKVYLREHTPIRIKELAQLNCYATEKIKNSLDKEYGENNYAIIAIGRSVSSMAELLKTMGVDSWIIPLSGLSFSIPWYCKTTYINVRDKLGKLTRISVNGDFKSTLIPEQLKTYSEFLKSIGLTKDEIRKNPDKKYIVMDYAHSGKSLKNALAILKDDDFLGGSPNIVKKSVNNLLGEDFYGMNFNALLNYERFKDYSYVGRMLVSNMENAFEHANPDVEPEYQGNITKGLRKLFWFNVFDSYINKTYKNCSIKHEMDAIHSHYLTEKALRVRAKITMSRFKLMEEF